MQHIVMIHEPSKLKVHTASLAKG